MTSTNAYNQLEEEFDAEEQPGSTPGNVFGVNKVWEENHGPHQVFVSVRVDMLTAIDTANQSFECRFAIKQRYMMSLNDKKIFDKDSALASEQIEWKPPPLTFPKAMEFKVLEPGPYSLCHFAGMMMIQHDTLVHAIFAERLELHSFPFDCQDLTLEVNWKVDEEVCKLWPSPGSASVVNVEVAKMSISEWAQHPPLAEFSHLHVSTVGKDLAPTVEMHPALRIRLKVERVWAAYIYQVFVVLALICLATFCAFSLPVDELGDRLAHVTTMFLTAVAFQFIISTMLPKLNYLTIVDKYVLACNCYIAGILFQVSFLAYYSRQSQDATDLSKTLDYYLICINFGMWIAIHFGLLLHVKFRVLPAEHMKLKMDSTVLDEIEQPQASLVISPNFFDGHNMKELPANFSDPNRTAAKKAPDLSVYGVSMTTALTAGEVKAANQLVGIYKSDFSHGMEFFAATVFMTDKKLALCLRKITGDPNVPAGKASLITCNLPLKIGDKVDASIQLRSDINNKDGFYWNECRLQLTAPGILVREGWPGPGDTRVFERV